MNTQQPISVRRSKYCDAIHYAVHELGHATNAMILEKIRGAFPDVSATTVHRATARLAVRGELMMAPSDVHGAMRYETFKPEHDHFMCNRCGELRDVDIVTDVAKLLKTKLDGCSPSGRIVVMGVCASCK